MWNKIKKGIKEAAGNIVEKRRKMTKNSWFDEEWQIVI
jgi:hypothetical protein